MGTPAEVVHDMQVLGREALCLLRCVSEHNSGLLAEFLEAGAGGAAQDRVSMSGHMSTLLVGLPVTT